MIAKRQIEEPFESEDEELDEEEEEEEEEEEDGPLAELRRRAPDVTITVVKQKDKVASEVRTIDKNQLLTLIYLTWSSFYLRMP